MAEANVEQVRRYILDGSDEDLRRLLTYSQVMAETARRAFRRVGLGANGAAIDCGCGPIGGLAVLAEIVGAAGRVVGVDFSEPAIQRARHPPRRTQLLPQPRPGNNSPRTGTTDTGSGPRAPGRPHST
jgi:threonine dehydrogenase-like Zn-dependent dehydrogenase